MGLIAKAIKEASKAMSGSCLSSCVFDVRAKAVKVRSSPATNSPLILLQVSSPIPPLSSACASLSE